MSRDLLDDLLADVPRHVAPDPARAWRAGTQRRHRTFAAEALAVAAAVALVGLGLVRLDERTPVAPVDRETVQGHPADVPRPAFLTDLPDRPGPLAGVFVQASETEQTWVGVAADGRSWRLPGSNPGAVPSLSRDGRWVAQVPSDTGPLRLSDLVTGQDVEFPEVGHTNDGRARDYDTLANRPAFWSPDGTRVAVPVWHPSDDHVGLVVLGTNGSLTPVQSTATLLGWQGDDRLVWLRGSKVVVTDLTGAVVDRVALQTTENMRALGSWRLAVSPDGSRLAVQQETSPTTLRVYSLDTGALVDDLTDTRPTDSVAVLWQGDHVVEWTPEGLVDASSGDPVVRLSDRWSQLNATGWATDALAGPRMPGPGVTEWRYWPFLWWWKQILAGLAVLVVVGAVWWLDRHDRRRLRGAA